MNRNREDGGRSDRIRNSSSDDGGMNNSEGRSDRNRSRDDGDMSNRSSDDGGMNSSEGRSRKDGAMSDRSRDDGDMNRSDMYSWSRYHCYCTRWLTNRH